MRDCRNTPLTTGTDVRVVAYGNGARAEDCGLVTRIVRVNRTRVVITDARGILRAVDPGTLLVLS